MPSAAAGRIGGYADGGRPPVGQVSIVGERGPEFFVPDTAGRVMTTPTVVLPWIATPHDSHNYNPNLNITTGPVMQMDNKDYISRDFERGMRQASDDGAKRGEAMTSSTKTPPPAHNYEEVERIGTFVEIYVTGDKNQAKAIGAIKTFCPIRKSARVQTMTTNFIYSVRPFRLLATM